MAVSRWVTWDMRRVDSRSQRPAGPTSIQRVASTASREVQIPTRGVFLAETGLTVSLLADLLKCHKHRGTVDKLVGHRYA